MPINEIATSKLVAADGMDKLFAGYGGAIISRNGYDFYFWRSQCNIYDNKGRVFSAMAKDKMFLKVLKVHPKYKTPGRSLMIQAVGASILTLTGTYDQILLM